jgi:4-oxalocrotonate tautomerase
MPLITVTIVAGRDPARKRALIRELAEAAARTLDAPIGSVRVILHEVPPEHWGIGTETKAEQMTKAQEGQ